MKVRNETLQKEGERIAGKRETGVEIGRDGGESMPRSRRWFSGDMFLRPTFNFAQKLKWYRPVSERKEFTTRGDWKKKLGGGGNGGQRRPAGARQNLNPFKQLPHFAGVYNSWEAAPEGKHGENCAAWKTSRHPSVKATWARANKFPWKKDSPVTIYSLLYSRDVCIHELCLPLFRRLSRIRRRRAGRKTAACDSVLQIIIRSLQRELVYKDEVDHRLSWCLATLFVNVAWN